MKKRLALIIAFIVAAMLLVSCGSSACTGSGGYQAVDTVWKFDKAIIALPNGEIVSGNVEQWRDLRTAISSRSRSMERGILCTVPTAY